MGNFRTHGLGILVAAVAFGGLMAGCTVMDPKPDTVGMTEAIRKAPEYPPQRNITNFSGALRCMDTTMINYGVRDVSVLVEDITDQTKKVNAGTKDMLISAVSDMTKRSRAFRLVAFGQDSGNLVAFYQQAERKNAYAVIPQFDIKGSITQLDENMVKKQNEAGIGWAPYLNLGAARTAASSILGLDLTVLYTDDMSIVPGVTSRNSVAVYKEGQGYDGDATIRKFSINYSMSLSKSEGQAQALRNLVELAAVELFGKLTKTPYWSCLGVDPKNAEIQNEMADWFHSLMANPPELAGYFQHQLRLRGYYNGPVDGQPNAELSVAVARYRKALGLKEEPRVDLEFFSAYLNADHAAVLAKNPPPVSSPQPVPQAAPQSVPPQPQPAKPMTQNEVQAHAANPSAPAPLALSISAANGSQTFKRGETINVVLRPNRDAHVYCYLQDENQKIQRFFPNRFRRDSLVRASSALSLPGNMRFQLVANDRGMRETVACFATERDVTRDVPGIVTGTDFENLAVTSLERVNEAFARAAGNNLALGVLNVDIR